MTNAQAALIAAANQLPASPLGKVAINFPDGRQRSVDINVATKLLAADYVTWLDQQDELANTLAEGRHARL